MEKKFNPETNLQKQFAELRLMAHVQSNKDLEERIKTNPIPTEDEAALGLFKERLEPQVREVLLDLHRKGYHTMSSGFDYQEPTKQNICFYDEVRLSEEVKNSIESLGAEVTTKPFHGKDGSYWEIEFSAEQPNLESIKLMWNKIGQLMPPTGYKPWRSSMADKFEKTLSANKINGS